MEKAFLRIKSCALGKSSTGGDIEKLINAAESLQSFIESECVFSFNEEMADLSDEAIKYLTLPLLLGLLLVRQKSESSESRLQILERAKAQIESFTNLAKAYGLEVPKLDPSERSDKIRLSSLISEFEHSSNQLDFINSEADEYRQITIDFVKFCIYKSILERLYVDREIDLLKNYATSAKKEESNSVPLPKFKPYVLGSRADLQKQVFQPGHNLPTLSIEEFYEMRYGQGKDKPLTNQPIKPKKDANDEDESSVYMQRKKDEFNDDNARGSGNRFNRS